MSVDITDDPAQNRYEIRVDGELAGVAEYRRAGGLVHFTHTEIADAFGGRGLARQLVEAALTATRAAGEQAMPHCPYVRKVMAEAPDRWLDLVPADRRADFDLPA